MKGLNKDYEITLKKEIKRADNAKKLAREKYKLNKEQGKYEGKSKINKNADKGFTELWD